jgi:hypothetical protein
LREKVQSAIVKASMVDRKEVEATAPRNRVLLPTFKG